jgi:hypothetical protein
MRGDAHCGTEFGLFVIKGIAFRFNGALGFGGGRRLRARTHHLSGLIGGGVCKHAPCAESTGIAAVLGLVEDEAARAWYLGQAEWLEVPAGGRTFWLLVGVVCLENRKACLSLSFVQFVVVCYGARWG